ncbi:hypothetical protein FRC04_009145 [Tulasnella sp. 424]|nr:hypothetical protein FRC04_009145 [Tulasnella sp. 424]
MDTKKLHRERHKRWGTPSPWAAEWFANTVTFCKTPEGKKLFEEWVRVTYGPELFQRKMSEIYAPPRRRYGSYTGNAKMWNSAAVELGVSDEFIKEAHTFFDDAMNPHLIGLRVESVREVSSALCARLIRIVFISDALLMGAKGPSIQWDELRRIAFSEFDHIRDQMEAWRTQPGFFIEGLRERAKSTISNPGDAAPGKEWSQACMDAMRSRLHLAHTQYAAWSRAASLFEDLDRMGATTAPAVLKVIKKDSHILGRLVAMLCATIELGRWQNGKLAQVLTSSEYLRPFFHRTRDKNGVSQIYTNEAYARRANRETNSIELFLTNWLKVGGPRAGGAPILAELRKRTSDPKEAAKLSSEALQTIGDHGPVTELGDAFQYSPFAFELSNLIEEANRTGVSKSWESLCLAVPPRKFNGKVGSLNIRHPSFAEYDRLYRHQSITWLGVIWQLEFRDGLKVLLDSDQWGVEHYDWMWFTLDQILWEEAKSLERTSDSVAMLYGLIAPDDKNRPLATRSFLDDVLRLAGEVTASERRRKEEEELRASFVQNIPTATPQESTAKAPQRGAGEPQIKVRKRRKGKAASAQPEASPTTPGISEPHAVPDVVEKNTENRNLPDFLPMDWKLSRKTVDIFHRLLDPKGKSGQMRWADFETAMRQIGFDVIQTEGSSVRFDPPAKRARPITFHRPHPDSTMTPDIIRLVGARLTRCYGWTADSFTGDATDNLNATDTSA